MSRHTYIYFGNYAKTNFGTDALPGPQILVEFRDEDDRRDGKAVGFTAFRAGKKHIRIDVVEHFEDFDCSNGDEIKTGWYKEENLFCHNLGIIPLLNTICLMRLMHKSLLEDNALIGAVAAIAGAGGVGDIVCRFTDAIVQMREYIVNLKRLPVNAEGISGTGCFLRLKHDRDLGGDWTKKYCCPEDGRTVSLQLEDGLEPGWHYIRNRVVLYKTPTDGGPAIPFRFYDLNDPCTWFETGAASDYAPAPAAAGGVPKTAVFSVDARYCVLSEKAYEVLELVSELGREYLKIRNENGEEIWLDRSKAVKTA